MAQQHTEAESKAGQVVCTPLNIRVIWVGKLCIETQTRQIK
jgi:hypothetical protein